MYEIASNMTIEDRELRAADAGDGALEVIRSLQDAGKLPKGLPQGTVRAMETSLKRYFGKIAADKVQEVADKARQVVEETLKTEQQSRSGAATTTTVGTGTGEGVTKLTEFVRDMTGANVADTMNMGFFQRVAREVALGAVQYAAQNMDQTRVDEFPALELVREFDRETPRGYKRVKGELVEDEENGWPARWEAALEASGDEAAQTVYESTGRMIALKDSGVWQALGDGAGGYDDTLGNPYAPFAFNSGMLTEEVSFDDCVDVGLIDDGDEVRPAHVDVGNLISLPVDASRLLEASLKWRELHASGYKNTELAKCPGCGKLVNIAKEPEVSMGAVACPHCEATVTQEHLLQSISR